METANVWHVSSSTWTFACPPSLRKELRQPTLTLENGIKWVSNKARVKSENAIRQNGTGKYTTKALAFRPRSRTSPWLSIVA